MYSFTIYIIAPPNPLFFTYISNYYTNLQFFCLWITLWFLVQEANTTSQCRNNEVYMKNEGFNATNEIQLLKSNLLSKLKKKKESVLTNPTGFIQWVMFKQGNHFLISAMKKTFTTQKMCFQKQICKQNKYNPDIKDL